LSILGASWDPYSSAFFTSTQSTDEPPAMIDLYHAATPNGQKLVMCLEELGLPYRRVPVRLSKGEQFAPAFLAISPNNKIPALVDHAPADGGAPLALFESGALLAYLAEKTGRLLPDEPRARLETLQWLFWQVGGLGPMAGQAGHFRSHAPEPLPYAIERYARETARLYGVLDRRLAGREFIVNAFSIADIACYPWIVPHEAHGLALRDYPNLARWFERIAARPATQRAYVDVAPTYGRGAAALSDEARRALFGGGPRQA
jgi:GST-like protein